MQVRLRPVHFYVEGTRDMSQLTTEEKLTLVVRAQVARIRAAEANQRARTLQRRMNALLRTLDRFQRLHGREADLHSATDRAAVQSLRRSRDPGATSPEIVQEVAQALEQDVKARVAAKEALVAVQTAWGGGGPGETVVDWVGLPRDEIEQTLFRALGGQPAEMATSGASATNGEPR